MKSVKPIVTIALLCISTLAPAGTWAPRPQAIWNFASGHAFMTQCAVRGHARMEPIAELGALYKQMLTDETYEDWRKVYQRSVHEKRMYSIAKDQWMPYTINAQDCKDTDRLAEMFILRFKAGQADQLTK